MAKVKMQPALEIAGVSIKPGSRQSVDIQLPSFYTHSRVNMPVHVVRGRQPSASMVANTSRWVRAPQSGILCRLW